MNCRRTVKTVCCVRVWPLTHQLPAKQMQRTKWTSLEFPGAPVLNIKHPELLTTFLFLVAEEPRCLSSSQTPGRLLMFPRPPQCPEANFSFGSFWVTWQFCPQNIPLKMFIPKRLAVLLVPKFCIPILAPQIACFFFPPQEEICWFINLNQNKSIMQ